MLAEEINTLLADKSFLLTDAYFQLQETFEKKYGTDTIVFMEIGAFFEVYEVDNDELQIGKAKEMANLLNIQLTKKNKSIAENSKKNPLLAGVPSVSFERYLNRVIAEERYTVVLIRQKGQPPHVKRYLAEIISPGTNFDYIQNNNENYIASLFIDKNRDIFSVGYAAIDVTTGKTYLYEAHGSSEDKTFALDEVFHLLNAHRCSEVVLTLLDGIDNPKEIVRYLEIEGHIPYTQNQERHAIHYQNELFKTVYTIESLLSPIEHLNIERMPLVSESLSVLIHFIIEHDQQIIQKLSMPVLIDNNYFLYLGNNALEQLSVISKDKDEQTLLKLIDKSSTAIGKRLLKERLLSPIMDVKELNRRYTLSAKVNQHAKRFDQELKNIYDLERILRRIKLGKLHPFEVNFLHDSLQSITRLGEYIHEHNIEKLPFEAYEVKNFQKVIEERLDLAITAKYTQQAISENFFYAGIDPDVDRFVEENRKLFRYFHILMDHIEQLLTKVTNRSESNFVQLGELDKDGHFISLSQNRFKMIERELMELDILLDDQRITYADLSIKKLTNSVKITSNFTDAASDLILRNKEKIVSLVRQRFLEQLTQFDKKYSLLIEKVAHFVADIDVASANAKMASTYNYARPVIVEDSDDKNFLYIKALRHPLIEVQENSGIYVPNDIVLGSKEYLSMPYPKSVMLETNENRSVHGVLLYGINSSGKSSLMKSIGLSVILAQSGFFVPASAMKFSIFDALFTRIVSKDNLTKGLSTFAVEMLELKNIFNRISNKSLVLGDEISHGTETLSGVSIVASAILKLAKTEAIFLFATHLHQLASMKELQELNNVINLHLDVKYDEANDHLIFSRLLEAGSGSSVYGLEFAKSLHMDKEFLDNANKIRKKLSNEYSEIELITQKRKSKYNKNLMVTRCVICEEVVDDVHHINEQNRADQNDMIDHFHKNHKYNLLPLCKLHHKLIHDGKIRVNGFVMTSKGLQLHYEGSEE
jgi:DNA mismatch repair protein MutS